MSAKQSYIDIRLISKVLGAIICVISLLMLVPALISLFYGASDFFPILISSGIGLLIGLVMRYGYDNSELSKHTKFSRREGFIIVSFAWIVASLIGTLPFVFWDLTKIGGFCNAYFETVAGFTTTGLSTISNVEMLPKGLLFWRIMTHWIGGIGIIVFILAIIPMMGGSSGVQNLFSAEISGPTKDKIHSKTASAAKILIAIYVGLTAIETILLYLGDMSLYDAVCHSFSTIGTGGFSTKNNSIIGFSNYTKVIITVFMFLAGINYGLYYFILKGRFKKLTSNSEFKGYLLFTIASIIALSAFLFADNYNPHNTITDALQNGAFMAVSVITTTGFSSTNYDFWLHASSFFLLILFFTGASSGSSTGGIKMSRYVLMFKNTFAEFRRAIHPRAVIPVKYNGNIIETSVIFKVLAFFFLYILMVMIGGLIFYANGRGLMFSFSLAASAIGNIGLVIHDANAAVAIWDLSVFEKIFTSVLMIIGRLEIFTVLILFTPEFWKK